MTKERKSMCDKLLKILLWTQPVSTATPEKFFSDLKRIKIYTRQDKSRLKNPDSSRSKWPTVLAVHNQSVIHCQKIIGEIVEKVAQNSLVVNRYFFRSTKLSSIYTTYCDNNCIIVLFLHENRCFMYVLWLRSNLFYYSQ